MEIKNDIRGFDKIKSGNCILCNKPLGIIRHIHKIPIFDPSINTETKGLTQYINQFIHHDCWYLWDERDIIAKVCVEQTKASYIDAKQLVEGEFVAAWGYFNSDIEFSHGSIFLPRSSLLFNNIMGLDVRDCEIRGRTSNLCQLLDVIKSNKLSPGFKTTIDSLEGNPDLNIRCYDFVSGLFLEVELTSTHKYGINCTCFLLKDDIDLIQAYTGKI